MKLSFANFPLEYLPNFPQDDKSVLGVIRECGFTCTDYNITLKHLDDEYEAKAENLKKALAELDMTAYQAHAPIVNPFDPKDVDYMQVFERSLRFCQIAGIPGVVIHGGAVKGNTREEFIEKNVNFYKSLIPAAEKTGVEVLIENIGHAGDDYFFRYGADLRETIDKINHPLFNVCWDTGHGNLTKQDLYETVKLLGSNLHALHVHDNAGYFEPSYRHHRIDMHIPPYATQYACINYDALIQGLIDVGYKGTFNFEVLTVTRSIRPSFTYNGEVVRTLEFPSLDLWKKANSLVFEIGKYMLESYGLFEG